MKHLLLLILLASSVTQYDFTAAPDEATCLEWAGDNEERVDQCLDQVY
jgi:hypothetical protein